MSHGNDKRLSSRRWRDVREEVLRRDLHRCQWRLAGCTEYADTVDHIVPRDWGGSMWDRVNLVAACKHCNRKRQSLAPGESGNPYDGGRPERGGAMRAPFFSGQGNARGGVAKVPPRSRWSVIRADYSRKERAS
jgi:hypothetical protein